MTKQHKNIIGLFSLLAVVFTTVFAANLPSASAAGNACTISSIDGDPDYDAYGYGSFQCDLSEYGYGYYSIKITGDGEFGYSESTVDFYYLPLTFTIERDEDDAENPSIILDYNSEDVKSAVVEVLDKGGNQVFAPITVTPMTNNITLPFFENKVKSGDYTIKVTTYDASGNMLYEPYQKPLLEWSSIHIPDTGALFQNLNISRTDYLITGVIIFTIVAVFSLIFTIKNKKNRSNSKYRR